MFCINKKKMLFCDLSYTCLVLLSMKFFYFLSETLHSQVKDYPLREWFILEQELRFYVVKQKTDSEESAIRGIIRYDQMY